MSTLAIKGHPERGEEVIELLEMLGGKNNEGYGGSDVEEYYIIKDGEIAHAYDWNDYITFTLEKFLKKFPYKVGNRVIYHETNAVVSQMKWDGREIVYTVECKNELWETTVFYLQPYKEEPMEENTNYCQVGKITAVCFQDANYEDRVELQLGNYELKEEDNKWFAIKKYSQYPKTYEECAKVLLERASVRNDIGYKGDLIVALQRLLICRDAYWRIAGEQMGLGKPWKPDWENAYENHYTIVAWGNDLKKGFNEYSNRILVFPTAEMRDAFYENFKELIEECKELL